MKDNIKKFSETLKGLGYDLVSVNPAAREGLVNISLEAPLAKAAPKSGTKNAAEVPATVSPFEPVKTALAGAGLTCGSLRQFLAVPRSAIVVADVQLESTAPRK